MILLKCFEVHSNIEINLFNIDKEKLLNLRKEIIENLSKITHKKIQTTAPNSFNDINHVRNYKVKKIGYSYPEDFYSVPDDLYEVEYDYLEYHILVFLIDELLNNNLKVIDQIKENTLEEQINNLIKKGLYEEVEILANLRTKEANIYNYYSQVLQTITPKLAINPKENKDYKSKKISKKH